MDQISRLYFDVIGRDKGGSKVLTDSAKASDAAHQSMARLGSTLSGLGGPFDQVTQLGMNLSGTLEMLHTRGQRLTAAGLGVAGVGVALIGFASKDQQAQKQLQQSIDNTGASYSDYRSQVHEAIHTQEQFAHTADDTMNALNTLTTASQNPKRAFNDLALAADIAAKKHESLSEAAQQLVLMEQGNTKAFRQYGITLDGVGSKTGQVDRALRQLSDRLHGQAPASVDTFTGRLHVWGVELEDRLAQLGKYGPVLTLVGAGLTTVGAVTQILASRRLADTATTIAETAAQTRLTAALAEGAAAATANATATTAMDLAQAGSVIGAGMAANLPGKAGLLGRLAIPLTVAASAYYGYKQNIQTDSSGMSPADKSIVARLEKRGPDAVQSFLGGSLRASDAATKALKEYLAQVQKTPPADAAAKKAADAYSKSLLHEKVAATQATLGIDGQITALDANAKASIGLSQAEDDLRTAGHNLAQSIHDGSKALVGHSAAAQSNRDALRAQVSQMLSLIDAEKAAHVGQQRIRTSAIDMATAIEQNAVALGLNRGEVDRLLNRLGVLPPQIARVLGATELLSEQTGEDIMDSLANGIQIGSYNAVQSAAIAGASVQKQMRLSAGLDAGVGNSGSFTPHHDKSVEAAKRYGQKLADTTVNAYAPVVDTGVKDAAKKALEAAKQELQQGLQQISGYYQQEKASLMSSFGGLNANPMVDSLGTSGPPPSVLSQLRQGKAEIHTFVDLWIKLDNRGLDHGILALFTGPEFIPEMRQLLHTKGGIRQADRLERGIRRDAQRLAARATEDKYGPEIAHLLKKLPVNLGHELLKVLRHEHIYVKVSDVDKAEGRKVHAS